MRKAILMLPLVLAIASPAKATGGMVCKTAGADPISVSVGYGHVPGSPLISTALVDDGEAVPVEQAQWWLDDREMRLLLISPQALREEVRIHVTRNGQTYDGSIWRNGLQRWVRCREG